MDLALQLLKRQVTANPGDVETLQAYIRALERAQAQGRVAVDGEPPIKFFLLSTEGERHEDRLPYAIFSTVQAARSYIQNYANHYYQSDDEIVVSERSGTNGDYGDYIEFWEESDEPEMTSFILESFVVDQVKLP